MNDIDPHVAADFFAFVLLAGVAMLVVAITRPPSRQAVADDALRLVTVVAGGATVGSLYFSEVADFVPCEMCWFQRIAMYPIAVLGVIASFRRDRSVLPYVAVLASLGLVASIYHIGIQLFPEQSTFCDVANPCSAQWVEGLGWMSIPQMAGLSFAAIIALTVVSIRTPHTDTPPKESS
jgi:disulfide bond formation protein DsbB